MRVPGVVSRGVQSAECCEYEDKVLPNGMTIGFPTWLYTVCVFRGHVFRYCADGRLTSASDDDVREALNDGRLAVVNELLYMGRG